MKSYHRLGSIPPYAFAELNRMKSEMLRRGCDVIDLSIGDPDLSPPREAIASLNEGLGDPRFHKYPPYEGIFEYRKSVADYYRRRFGVKLDPESEVIALIGSKEGIAHLTLGLVDSGDVTLVPNPGYPVYGISTLLAGGVPYELPLLRQNDFLPSVEGIGRDILRRTKLMYVNYPNNPTGAVCPPERMAELVSFAADNQIVLCNDAAYNEIVFGGAPFSMLSIEGAKESCVEFGTLSKSYSMTGWRIGYAVGSRDTLRKLLLVKSNLDSGQFGAIQHAASVCLDRCDYYLDMIRETYKKRRDAALSLLSEKGLQAFIPEGTFYIWLKVPGGLTSAEFAGRLISNGRLIVTPGCAFGDRGEGYCRLSLTAGIGTIGRAAERIAESL